MPEWLNRLRGTGSDTTTKEDDMTQPTGPWDPPPGYGDEDPETTTRLTVPRGAHEAYEAEPHIEDVQLPDPAATDPRLGDVRAAADANAEHSDDEYESCPECGHKLPAIRELLNDTLGQVGTRAGELLAQFYRNLFNERPDVADLFPDDLVDAASAPSGGGAMQREKLLNAAVAVATHYNPQSAKSMKALDAALDKMGATHGESRMRIADPDWPGGYRPLLQREYDLVNFHLITTLKAFQGDTWTPLHTRAWWVAMTYVADRMGAAQILALPRHGKR